MQLHLSSRKELLLIWLKLNGAYMRELINYVVWNWPTATEYHMRWFFLPRVIQLNKFFQIRITSFKVIQKIPTKIELKKKFLWHWNNLLIININSTNGHWILEWSTHIQISNTRPTHEYFDLLEDMALLNYFIKYFSHPN